MGICICILAIHFKDDAPEKVYNQRAPASEAPEISDELQPKILNGANSDQFTMTGHCPEDLESQIQIAARAVVQLTLNGNQRLCTGVILKLPGADARLRGRLILTAAHCVAEARRPPMPVQGIQVHREAVSFTTTDHGIDVVAAYVTPTYQSILTTPYFLEYSPGDYAILETASPVGLGGVTPSNEDILVLKNLGATFFHAGVGRVFDRRGDEEPDPPLNGYCFTDRHSVNGEGVEGLQMTRLANSIRSEQAKSLPQISNAIRFVVPVGDDDWRANGIGCPGDSGSPLYAVTENQIEIIGLVSGVRNVEGYSSVCGTGSAFATPPPANISLGSLSRISFNQVLGQK